VEDQPAQIPPTQPPKQHKPSRTESKREAPDPSKPRAWSSVVGGVTSGGLPGQNNLPIVEPIVVNSQELATNEEEIVTTPASSVSAVVAADKPKAAPRPEVLNSLYVSNLGAGCDMDEIKELFSRYGKVKTIKYTPPQSYCFVDYESAESADKALKGGPIKLGDFDLKLERRKTPTFNNPRGRGARGARGGGRGRGGPPRDSEPRTTDRTERREPRGDARPREGNDRRPPNKDERGGRAGGRGRGGGARAAPPAATSS